MLGVCPLYVGMRVRLTVRLSEPADGAVRDAGDGGFAGVIAVACVGGGRERGRPTKDEGVHRALEEREHRARECDARVAAHGRDRAPGATRGVARTFSPGGL